MSRIAPLSRLLWAGALLAQAAYAGTVERRATVADLFDAAEASALAGTLAPDRPVHFRLRVPAAAHPGVLVFVRADDSGEPPAGWEPVLEQHALLWIAAEGFGNRQPTAQRMLVALMGLELARREVPLDTRRAFVGGMSGGGRVASHLAVRFPRRFSGAVYIVGADAWSKDEEPQLPLLAANRYVFVTGPGDFNRGEMRSVFAKYRKAGVNSRLLDVPGLAHEYPDGTQLERALQFLDADQAGLPSAAGR